MISQNLATGLGIKYRTPLILSLKKPQGRWREPTRLLKGSGQTMSRNTYKWIHMLPIALMRLQEAPKNDHYY